MPEYKELILKDSNLEIFKFDSEIVKKAKSLLFIRENILNLIFELDYEFIKTETSEVLNNKALYLEYCNKIFEKKEYLFRLGELLGNKLSHTVSKDYLNYITNTK